MRAGGGLSLLLLNLLFLLMAWGTSSELNLKVGSQLCSRREKCIILN